MRSSSPLSVYLRRQDLFTKTLLLYLICEAFYQVLVRIIYSLDDDLRLVSFC